jgi:lysyl-tRNA synthetase class 2
MNETWWRREQFERRRQNLAARGRIITAIRDFFAARDFVEVETPALQRSPGMEPHLQAFATEWHEPGEGATPLYLHTSPEFAMKKLLAAGMPKIVQPAPVFRAGERPPTHHPEFTMLEWYRAGAGYRDLMTDCEDLLRACLAAAAAKTLRWNGRRCDPTRPFQRLSMAEAFRRYCAIDLLATAPDANAPSFALLVEAARPLGIAPHDGDEWEDLFFRIFLDWVEPQLGVDVPTILYDYPIALAALARAKAEDARLAERFELYVAGLELANAFGELTDPVLQRVSFVADQGKKYRRYGVAYPIDEDFIAALGDMPDSAGIALGVDRLVMLATGAADIEEVLWAPVR